MQKSKKNREENKSAALTCLIMFLAIFGMIAHWVIFGY